MNNAINCTLERESLWTTKKSTTVECEATFRHAVHLNTAQDEIPQYTREQAAKLQHNFNNSVKNTAKTHIDISHIEETQKKVKSLVVQGVNLSLDAAENSDFIWKSYMYDLKRGTLKFLLNASIDTLPTAANLVRWKKSTSDKCNLCMCRQTTYHCQNICKVGLDTGRWTWRHNNIVNYVVQSLDVTKYTIFSDIEGHQASGGGSIPPKVCITNLKPDITIWDKAANKFHIFKLTCPLEKHIKTRHTEKSNKYAHFVTDISHIQTTVTAFEVSRMGYLSPENHKYIQSLHKLTKPGIKLSTFKKNISNLGLYSSYHIWLCRNDAVFVVPPYLQPQFSDTQQYSYHQLYSIKPMETRPVC